MWAFIESEDIYICLAICQLPDSPPLADSVFDHGWAANHDGAGIMYSLNGELHVIKPLYKLTKLKGAYQEAYAVAGKTSCIVTHLRYSTHGDKSAINVHPHILDNGNAALVHNGILSDCDPGFSSKISDTAYFCQTVLAHRPAAQLLDAEFCDWLEALIGHWNKLILMGANGDCRIVNESAGIWEGSVWYSNASFLPPAPKVLKPLSTSFGGSGNWDRILAEYGKEKPACTIAEPSRIIVPAKGELLPFMRFDTPERYVMGEATWAEFESYCQYTGDDPQELEAELRYEMRLDDDFQAAMDKESWADECSRINAACALTPS